jgi:hypothetical protein
MRITVEIDGRQRVELLQLAAPRGENGLSCVVREAVDQYLRCHQPRKAGAVARALALQGSFGEDAADALEASVRQLRGAPR